VASPEDLHDLDVELTRIVDRLNGMPLPRAATAADACLEAAGYVLARARELDPAIPPDAVLPRLGPQGLGAMIAVIGRDYRAAAQDAPGTDVRAVVDRLAALRRSLP
jgi:hypothetical protein